MRLDHGLLNLPLSKRGDIDKQIDRYKAEQFAIREQARKAGARERKALISEARELIDRVSDERMAELGKPHGMTARQCRKQWRSIADLNPQNVIRVMRKELGL
jgi:hypothetical protein